MRIFLSFLFFTFLISACQQAPSQYTEDSPEIDKSKAVIKAYEEGNWDFYSTIYADTAKIYHNTTEPVSYKEMTEALQEILKPIAEYSFGDDIEFEFVTTDSGNQWVEWWGVWTGKIAANGQELKIPVHVSSRYVDGKIVQEHGYWDNQPIVAALTAIAEAEAAEGEK